MNNSPPPPYPENEKTSHITMADSFPPMPQFQPQHQNPSAPPAGNFQNPHPHVVQANTGSFGPMPVELDCPYCHQHVVTHTKTVAGTLPWLIMAVCFVLGFFLIIPWCICCVGFCIEGCLDTMHSCPSCKRVVGRFSRLG